MKTKVRVDLFQRGTGKQSKMIRDALEKDKELMILKESNPLVIPEVDTSGKVVAYHAITGKNPGDERVGVKEFRYPNNQVIKVPNVDVRYQLVGQMKRADGRYESRVEEARAEYINTLDVELIANWYIPTYKQMIYFAKQEVALTGNVPLLDKNSNRLQQVTSDGDILPMVGKGYLDLYFGNNLTPQGSAKKEYYDAISDTYRIETGSLIYQLKANLSKWEAVLDSIKSGAMSSANSAPEGLAEDTFTDFTVSTEVETPSFVNGVTGVPNAVAFSQPQMRDLATLAISQHKAPMRPPVGVTPAPSANTGVQPSAKNETKKAGSIKVQK